MNREIDLTNQQFERLTVIGPSGRDKNGLRLWLTRCTCGKEALVRSSALRSGKTKSCGCLRKECDAAQAGQPFAPGGHPRVKLPSNILASREFHDALARCRPIPKKWRRGAKDSVFCTEAAAAEALSVTTADIQYLVAGRMLDAVARTRNGGGSKMIEIKSVRELSATLPEAA